LMCDADAVVNGLTTASPVALDVVCHSFERGEAVRLSASDCDRQVRSALLGSDVPAVKFAVAAVRYARCAAQLADEMYRARVSSWLGDGAVLCHRWTDKFVCRSSELAHMLVTFVPMVLSLVMPLELSGVKVELQRYCALREPQCVSPLSSVHDRWH
jgi:hypothetical protein